MTNLPLAIRSRLELADAAPAQAGLSITPVGTTYTMAQEATWIDADHFAVGRWDGSLGVFQFTSAPAIGPMVAKAVNAPDQEGIQMITPVGIGIFASSNDEDSAILWTATQPDWTDLREGGRLSFDPAYGVANSGATLTVGLDRFFVMGHANGWVTIWLEAGQLTWTKVAATDVRSPIPVNPFQMFNVRGIAVLNAMAGGPGRIVTGSEDGNLTILSVPDGQIVSTMVYNPVAKRGINSIAVKDDILLVTNCAVGPADFNLWAYAVAPDAARLSLIDKANLVRNPAATQVFNFDVAWSDGQDSCFFCSTEEGLLWMGTCSAAGGLAVQGNQPIGGPALGSAICLQRGELVAVAYDLHEFTVAL